MPSSTSARCPHGTHDPAACLACVTAARDALRTAIAEAHDELSDIDLQAEVDGEGGQTIADDALAGVMAQLNAALGPTATTETRAEAVPMPNRYRCNACARVPTTVDEDGCCASCGADAVPYFSLAAHDAESRAAALEEAARIAENEPELPGDMPIDFRAVFEAAVERGGFAEACRALVKATKRPIAAAIRALALSPATPQMQPLALECRGHPCEPEAPCPNCGAE